MKKLEKQQMETTVGGVSKEEYCDTVSMILHNNAVELDSATAQLIYSICGPI